MDGGALITLINRCDRVKAACLAQLVNVIAPIMTEPGGKIWRQAIFHPFAETARRVRGTALRTAAEISQGTSLLCIAAVHDARTGRLMIIALNRDPKSSMRLDAALVGFSQTWVMEDCLSLHHADRHATNTKEAPDTVVPQRNSDISVASGRLNVELPPASWNLISLLATERPN